MRHRRLPERGSEERRHGFNTKQRLRTRHLAAFRLEASRYGRLSAVERQTSPKPVLRCSHKCPGRPFAERLARWYFIPHSRREYRAEFADGFHSTPYENSARGHLKVKHRVGQTPAGRVRANHVKTCASAHQRVNRSENSVSSEFSLYLSLPIRPGDI